MLLIDNFLIVNENLILRSAILVSVSEFRKVKVSEASFCFFSIVVSGKVLNKQIAEKTNFICLFFLFFPVFSFLFTQFHPFNEQNAQTQAQIHP